MKCNNIAFYSGVLCLSGYERRIGAFRRLRNRTTDAIINMYAGPWPKMKLIGVFKIKFLK